MGELHISQNMDHVSPDCFSSKELTNMCIQIVIKGEDQLFHSEKFHVMPMMLQ